MRAIAKQADIKTTIIERLPTKEGVMFFLAKVTRGYGEIIVAVSIRVEEHVLPSRSNQKLKILCASALDSTGRHCIKSTYDLRWKQIAEYHYQTCIHDIGRRIFLDKRYVKLDWSKSELIG